jgi:hypothetical protein
VEESRWLSKRSKASGSGCDSTRMRLGCGLTCPPAAARARLVDSRYQQAAALERVEFGQPAQIRRRELYLLSAALGTRLEGAGGAGVWSSGLVLREF